MTFRVAVEYIDDMTVYGGAEIRNVRTAVSLCLLLRMGSCIRLVRTYGTVKYVSCVAHPDIR